MDFSYFPNLFAQNNRAISALELSADKGQEIVKLYKIILNSKKVKEAREEFMLSEKDFIYHLYDNHFEIARLTSKDKIKEGFKKIKINMRTFHDDLKKFTQNDVIQYFGLLLPLEFVITTVFFGNKFTFQNKKYINPLIDRYNLKMDERIQTSLETPDGMKHGTIELPRKLSYSLKSISSVDFFDEKFELTQKYDQLKKNPSMRRKNQSKYAELLSEAKDQLKINTAFSAEDLSKIVHNFKSYFYEKDLGINKTSTPYFF